MLGARELRAFCRPPAGVPVSFAGVSRYTDDNSLICGLLDQAMQIKLGDHGLGGVSASLPELRLPFDAYDPMPASGDVVTITTPETGATTDYQVDAPTAEDDGAFLCYQLLRTS